MSVTIGLDSIHYALMTDEEAETYETPKRLAGAIQLTITPTTNNATLYADDQAAESATTLGDITVSLNVKDIPDEAEADLLGSEIDNNGVLIRSSNDTAPYVALGYRRRKSNGKFRYIWLYKGRFRPSTQEAQTKGDTITWQTPTIEATFIQRMRDQQWQAVVNEDGAGVDPAVIAGWFDEVYEKN